MPGDQPRFDELLRASPARWDPAARRAVLHFGLLCGGIVLMTMLPFRIGREDKTLAYILLVAVIAGLLTLVAARARLATRLPRTGVVVGAVRRHLGLPLVGLVFFVAWTAVYACLWLFHPDEAFTGLPDTPRLSDFFYYAVSTAFLSPPEGIAAGSRGVRAASLIELVMGLAVVASYVGSLFDWSRGEPGRPGR
ncbi:MAG: hypothetical protein ACKVUT_07075 [Gaiella sp.]